MIIFNNSLLFGKPATVFLSFFYPFIALFCFSFVHHAGYVGRGEIEISTGQEEFTLMVIYRLFLLP